MALKKFLAGGTKTQSKRLRKEEKHIKGEVTQKLPMAKTKRLRTEVAMAKTEKMERAEKREEEEVEEAKEVEEEGEEETMILITKAARPRTFRCLTFLINTSFLQKKNPKKETVTIKVGKQSKINTTTSTRMAGTKGKGNRQQKIGEMRDRHNGTTNKSRPEELEAVLETKTVTVTLPEGHKQADMTISPTMFKRKGLHSLKVKREVNVGWKKNLKVVAGRINMTNQTL